jgi:hypothetical protein
MLCAKMNVALLKFPVYNVEEPVGIAAFEGLGYHSKPAEALPRVLIQERKVEDTGDTAMNGTDSDDADGRIEAIQLNVAYILM